MTTVTPIRRRRKTGVWTWFKHQTNAFKAAVSIIAAIGGLLTAFALVDARYANAGDVGQLRLSIERNQLANEIHFLSLRRSAVHDRIYNLQAKGPRLNPYERQELQRLSQEANDLGAQISQKQQILDRQRVRQ